MSVLHQQGHLVLAVGAASAQLTLTSGVRYVLTSTTDCWVSFGTNPTAVAGTTGNVYLPAGRSYELLANATAAKVAAIRVSADGFLSAAALWG